jgi:hypothetical protein
MVPKSGEDGGPHTEAIGEPPHHRRQEGQGHGPGVSTNPAARARPVHFHQEQRVLH